MRQQFLKRLLILLPAVWLIASAVFLLGKLMPGSAAEMAMLQASEGSAGNLKAAQRQKTLQQLRKRTGQDLPVFYIGFGTAAEPDTFYRIFPETDRLALRKLTHLSGNWPAVAAFYKNIQQLRTQSRNFPAVTKSFQRETEKLLISGSTAQNKHVFQQLKIAAGAISDTKLLKTVWLTEKSSDHLLSLKPGVAAFIPVLHWHGLQNQYHRWFSQLLVGKLGFSSRDGRPVEEILAEALEITLLIAALTFVITGLLAIEIAILLSRKSMANFRSVGLGFLYSLESLPVYIIALLLLVLSAGIMSDTENWAILPAVICLVLAYLPYLAAQAYTSLQQINQQPYILTARAKGLSEGAILRKQALKPALLPIITLLSDFLPALLAGMVVVEVVFSLPGMGMLLLDSVLARDYEVLAGLVLVTGSIKILAHLLADIFMVTADPRISNATA
jgi:peptide/nickel transport system permease protein